MPLIGRRRFTTALALALAFVPRRAAARRLLVFTKSADYEHDVVRRTSGAPATVERALESLGRRLEYETTITKDGSIFTPEALRGFDAIMFFTTGDLTLRGTDAEPPMPAGGKAALLEAVARGTGFIGVHSASDTFPSPDRPRVADEPRAAGPAPAIDPYIAMLGGEFIGHGRPQRARVRIADGLFPGMPRGAQVFERHGEWYALGNLASDLHALLVIETDGMEGDEYRRGPYPVAWARLHGRGRVFYTALGHFEEEWSDRAFLSMLEGGIRWAAGDVGADVTPNVRQVLPRASAQSSSQP